MRSTYSFELSSVTGFAESIFSSTDSTESGHNRVRTNPRWIGLIYKQKQLVSVCSAFSTKKQLADLDIVIGERVVHQVVDFSPLCIDLSNKITLHVPFLQGDRY